LCAGILNKSVVINIEKEKSNISFFLSSKSLKIPNKHAQHSYLFSLHMFKIAITENIKKKNAHEK
jgi:hypothetical protein